MFTRGVKVLAGLLLTAAVADAQPYNRPGLVPGPAGGTLYDAPSPANRYGYGLGFGGGYPGFGGVVVYPWYVSRPLPDFFDAPVIALPPPEVYAVPALPGQFLSAALAERERQETAARVRTRTALTIDLPAAAELFVNGVKQPGGPKKRHEVATETLQPGDRWDLQLRAGWTTGGKGYTFAESRTLAAGDSKTLLVYSGTPAGK